jgi:PAS domain S-box-containing protein
MEYDQEPFFETRPAPGKENKTKAPDRAFCDRRELVPLTQVATMVCAPTPPHTPFYVSGNLVSFLGYEPREIVGNSSFWMNSVHSEDIPQLLSGFFHLFTRGYHIYDYRFLRKDGACKRLLVELRLHRRRKKEPIAMMGFLREPVVTDWKIPGAEHAGAEFFRGDDTAQLTIDGGQRIRKANAHMEALCGLPSKDLIGKFALELIPPDYIHLAQDVFDKVVNQGRLAVRFWHAIRHSSGSLRFVAAECTGSRDESGKRMMAITCRDITGLIALDLKSRVRCTSRLLSTLSRGEGARVRAETLEPLDRLTAREREILYLTIEGLSSTQIGERLSISPRTVETHRTHIMNKLGVRSLSQLIRYTVSCITYPEPT